MEGRGFVQLLQNSEKGQLATVDPSGMPTLSRAERALDVLILKGDYVAAYF